MRTRGVLLDEVDVLKAEGREVAGTGRCFRSTLTPLLPFIRDLVRPAGASIKSWKDASSCRDRGWASNNEEEEGEEEEEGGEEELRTETAFDRRSEGPSKRALKMQLALPSRREEKV